MELVYKCSSCASTITIHDENIQNHHCPCKADKWTLLAYHYTEDEIAFYGSQLRVLYDSCNKILSRYIDMDSKQRQIIALWIVSTYCIECFSSFPFLFFNASKGSGKTRTITLISHLARGGDGKVYTGVNEVALFRAKPYSTLVLDECEKLISKEAQTLREYLQASYKSSATVSRAVKKKVNENGQLKETFVMEDYKPFRPVIMANINGMDDVLADRCLTFQLEKSDNIATTKLIEDFDNCTEIKELLLLLSSRSVVSCSVVNIKNNTKGWNNYILDKYSTNKTTPNYIQTQTTPNYTNYTEDDKKLYDKIDKMGINGRNLELVFPLLIMANVMGSDLLDEVIPIISEIINNKKVEEITESKDISVLQFVSEMTNRSFDFQSVKNLTNEYKEYIGWTSDEDWLNPKWLGRALTRLQLIAKKNRTNKGIEVMLLPIKAKELLKRYKVADDKKGDSETFK